MQTAESIGQSARRLLSGVIILLSAVLFYHLSLRLISQIHYHRAKNLFQEGYYGLTLGHLEKADHYQPDDYKIQKALGKVYFRLGELRPGAKDTSLLTQKSKHFYLKASRLNPLDAETAYGLGRGEARLEQLYQYLHPEKKENPCEPLHYFKQAAGLRPNGILYHYAMARYLYRQGKTGELLAVIRILTRIYPPVCHYLKKEDFWSLPVKEACMRGLREAIEKEVSQREAHMAISSIMAADKEWTAAISHYQEALHYKAFQNNTGNYIHLGALYLKKGQLEEAETSFFHAMDMSRSREKDLERVYHFYKKEGYPDKLYRFYQQADRRFILSSRIDILMARSLIDLKRYDQSQQILMDLNQKGATAEAYYWLARIAETKKDWDSMELAIQKATVLDSKNSRYHLIFSQVLKRLNKLDRAEKEAGLAIKHQAKPSPWLYNHRAWIRWTKQDYPGAVKDWRSAITLKPDSPAFYAQAAEAYRKLGDWPLALNYYKNALKIDPENKRYQKRYLELKAESSRFKVQGSRFKVQGSRFKVQGSRLIADNN